MSGLKRNMGVRLEADATKWPFCLVSTNEQIFDVKPKEGQANLLIKCADTSTSHVVIARTKGESS